MLIQISVRQQTRGVYALTCFDDDVTNADDKKVKKACLFRLSEAFRDFRH